MKRSKTYVIEDDDILRIQKLADETGLTLGNVIHAGIVAYDKEIRRNKAESGEGEIE